MTIKGQEDTCGDGAVWYLDYISINILTVIPYYIVLQDATFGRNWVKCTLDLLFLTNACESTITSK